MAPKKEEEIPETEETVIADLAFLRSSGLITEENYQDCVAATKKRFGNG